MVNMTRLHGIVTVQAEVLIVFWLVCIQLCYLDARCSSQSVCQDHNRQPMNSNARSLGHFHPCSLVDE